MTEEDDCSGSREYTLEVLEDDFRVCPAITPNPAELPNAAVDEFYSQQFTGSGGTGTYTFSVTSGSLPPGLSLTPEGLLSGTPDTEGSFNFTVTATDDNDTVIEEDDCPGSRDYTLLICPGITVGPGTDENLPEGFVSYPYNVTITASDPGATFELIGDLPPGLTGSTGSYVISGTPTTVGTYTFTVIASTSLGCTASRTFTIQILPASAIPTLTEWGMIVMMLALIGFSIIIMRRRQAAW